MQEESKRGFDIHDHTELLLRVHLLRTSPTSHILLVVVHHIVVDGWSLGVLFKELSSLYKSFSTQQPTIALPQASYAKFASWQRERMSVNNPVRQKLAKYLN